MAQVPSCSAVSQKPCLFSEDRSAYPQRLCYPCSPDLRPQHFLCFCFQELEKLGLGDSVDLHVYEIPVEYQTVQRLIPALWEKHSPQVSGAKVSGVKVGASLSGSAAGCPRHGWFVWLCSCSDHMVDGHSLIPPSATLLGYPWR